MLHSIKSTKTLGRHTASCVCLTFLAIGIYLTVGLPGCGSREDCASGTCTTEANCDDNDACTTDDCIFGCCTHAPITCDNGKMCVDGVCTNDCASDSDCDDSDLCTTDSCNGVTGLCEFAEVACPEGEVCNPLTGACLPSQCTSNGDCDDSNLCTTDTCNTDTGSCEFSAVVCPSATICDPATGDCVTVPCESDADCDDGVFCNGTETCDNLPGLAGNCAPGSDPCPGANCIEASMSCDSAGGGSLTTLEGAFGNYTGATDCDGVTITVFIGLDGSSFIIEGLSGDNRGFFPDEDKDGLTSTATGVTVNGSDGHTVTVTLDPGTGTVTLGISGPTVNCSIALTSS